jgi:hypothetical protein
MRRNKLNYLFQFLCNLSVLQDFFNRLRLLTFSSFICACHCHRQQNTSYYLTMKKTARNVFQSTYLSFYSYSWRICKDNLKYYYSIFSFSITYFIDSICSNYLTLKIIFVKLRKPSMFFLDFHVICIFTDTDIYCCRGYCIDLLRLLSETCNFTYNLVINIWLM